MFGLAQAGTKDAAQLKSRAAALTICSVSYFSKPFLELNHELTLRLNPGSPPQKWVVVENTPAGNEERLGPADPRFEVRPGCPEPEVEKEKGRGSYHHGAALNKAIQGLGSRFVLILDPDFFIIEPNWIERVLSHMEQRRLAFIGAPWHPRWYRKWRYFPCTHCLFIDSARVERESLDFTPEIHRQPSAYVSLFLAEHEWMKARGERLKAWGRILRHPILTLEEDRRNRLIIGSSRDTGIHVYDRFAHTHSIRYEVFTPVYRPRKDRMIPPPDVRIDSRSTIRELLEHIRQDSMSFVPKRRGSYSRKGFRHFGLPDLHQIGLEEFLWRRRPLGFHVRASLRGDGKRMLKIEDIVDNILKVIGGAGSRYAAAERVQEGTRR